MFGAVYDAVQSAMYGQFRACIHSTVLCTVLCIASFQTRTQRDLDCLMGILTGLLELLLAPLFRIGVCM